MYGDLCLPWEVTWCGDLTGVDPAVTGHALEAASEVLWTATGRRFGNCPVTVRPCRQSCLEAPIDATVWSSGHWIEAGWPYPTLHDGTWINVACGLCTGDCACTNVSEVVLPDTAYEIVDVVIDGASLPTSGYALYDGHRLVRTGADWPLCQDWTVTGGPGTWSITARFGAPLPKLGELAVGALALEIAKMCSGIECELPPLLKSITRQGVTMQRADISDILKHGLTGLDIPDRFIKMVNPRGLQDRARMYSPDRPLPRVPG